MSGDVLTALAQCAGQTVAAAAVTDMWEAVRGRFARLMGRGLGAQDGGSGGGGWRRLASSWPPRLPGSWRGPGRRRRSGGRAASRTCWTRTPILRSGCVRWWRKSRPSLPAGAVLASDYSVAAGRDVKITALGGWIAAGVIHGDVTPPGPTSPGPAMP